MAADEPVGNFHPPGVTDRSDHPVAFCVNGLVIPTDPLYLNPVGCRYAPLRNLADAPVHHHDFESATQVVRIQQLFDRHPIRCPSWDHGSRNG